MAVVSAVVFSAGCSGGGGSAVSFAPRPVATAPPGAQGLGNARLTVQIVIPSATAARAARRPAYVSSATNSLSLAQDGGVAQIFSLAASSPNCTTAPAGRTCSFAANAVAGPNRSFVAKLFASTDGSGTPLSAQTLVATIVAQRDNPLAFVLNGVVSSLSVAIAGPTLATGIPGTASVVVNGLDASGKTIVGPGVFADANGNPIVVTLLDRDTSGATHLATTTVTQAATVALAYDGSKSLASVTVSASGPNLRASETTITLGSPTSSQKVDATNAAVDATQTFYASLPHVDVQSDLAALAKEMVASGAYRYAAQTPGGISALLADGTPAIFFADHPSELVATAATQTHVPTSVAHPRSRGRLDIGSVSATATNHEIAMLVNTTDTGGAFTPLRQELMAGDLINHGFTAANGYNVDDVPITIENILALDSTHAIDLLYLATHGMIFGYVPTLGVTPIPNLPQQAYANASDTNYTATVLAAHQDDFDAGRLLVGVRLAFPTSRGRLAQVAFTPAFLTHHLRFNPGAIVMMSACFGQSPAIASDVAAVFSGSNVGRYFGWTKEVDGTDNDETDAFVFDRLLGGGDGGIETIVDSPPGRPQRPFPLDDIEGALTTEIRNGPITRRAEPYTNSDSGSADNRLAPPLADGSLSRLVVSDFGGETVAKPPIFYGLPSITTMSITETHTSGLLSIAGQFPVTPGSVTITNPTTGATATLVPRAWSTSGVDVAIPISGPGSFGEVRVLSSDGIGSNPVPLTKWSGKLAYRENVSIPNLGTTSGSGSGKIAVDYTINFRADVAPVVPKIDATPAPQNFAFGNVEGDSTAAITAYDGGYTSDDGKVVATFVSNATSAALTPVLPPLAPGTFEVRSFPSQPAPCNNGLPGVQGDPASNVFCPITGWFANTDVAQCIDSGENSACPGGSIYDIVGSYGGGFDAGGIISLTMDPSTYAIRATGTTEPYQSLHFGGGDSLSTRPGTATMTGTFSPPMDPPYFPSPVTPQRANVPIRAARPIDLRTLFRRGRHGI